MIDFQVLVVAYNSAADVPALLNSIAAAAESSSWQVIIVDNSQDPALAVAVADNDRVRLISAGANLGYSGGLNLARTHALPSRFTVFLNPDLALQPKSLTRLAQACVGDTVAAVPLVVDESGAPQPSLRREPTALRSLGEALLGDHWPNRPAWLAEMVRDSESYRHPHWVDWATGAALVVRTPVLEDIGPWDSTRFFLYSEETDYARRIRSLGYRIGFVPDAVVSHRGAGSGSSPALDALLLVNKLRYYRKWHGPVASLAFGGIAVVHSLLRARRPESALGLRAFVSRSARAELPGGRA